MNKEHPARAAGPPGRPALPPEAEAEIMERLSANMKITSEEIAAILAALEKELGASLRAG